MDDPVLLPLTHARRFAWPVPDLWACSSLSEADLRAYYRFRRQFMDLKPHVDPEKDWQTFAEWVRNADFCWFNRSPEGNLVGAATFTIESRIHEGQCVTLLIPEYGYTSPSARKSTGIAVALLTAIACAIARTPRVPLYFMGIGYLGSTTLAQVLDPIWYDEDPAMTPWERSLWWTFAGAVPGFEPSRRIVSMGTIPRLRRDKPPADPHVRQAYERYLKHNPNWFEGTCCICMGRIKPAFMGNAARWFARKILRTR